MLVNNKLWNKSYKYSSDNTPNDMFRRVAHFAAKNDAGFEDAFYEELSALRFVPAGRILLSAGTDRERATLSNCYFIESVPDSMVGIMKTLKESAITMQAGGGIGLDFSSLRPKGVSVKGTGSTSSGPISFMSMWDSMCQTIASAGARRGAMIGIIRVDHPDIEEFIVAKKNNSDNHKVLSQFNLSVAVTDGFMNAVQDNIDWDLVFRGKVYKTVKARYLWDLIMRSNYEKAEPGVLFIDRINKQNNLYYCEELHGTNPCGEQPLQDYGSCNLGAINLTQFIKDTFTDNSRFNYDALSATVRVAVRFMDNILDLNYYPLIQQREEAVSKRRIGIGIMGLGSTLAMLRIKYGSQESLECVENIMGAIRNEAYLASSALAKEKGCFKGFDKDKYLNAEFIKSLPESIRELIRHNGIRNSHLLTIAPTGTIARLVGNVSGGVEPIFDIEYKRNVGGQDEDNIDYAYDLYKTLGNNGKPNYFVTAHDITPEEHLNMMSLCQKYVDASVSKTVNMPEDISYEDFKNTYLLAYKLGCKGCTTYREGTLSGILKKKEEVKDVKVVKHTAERSYILDGKTFKVKLPGDKHAYYLNFTHINGDKKKPFELFVNTKDPSVDEWTKAFGRIISAVFRAVNDPTFLIDELKEVYGKSGFFSSHRGRYVPSLIAEFGYVMQDYFTSIGLVDPEFPITNVNGSLDEGSNVGTHASKEGRKLGYCKVCGEYAMIFKEGCCECLACGFNKCG